MSTTLKAILFSLCLFSLSCYPGNVKQLTPTRFDLSDYKNHVIDTSIIDKFEYIPLETRNSCLIGEISKVLIYQEKIIIFDKRYAQSVFLFSKEGKFIRSIGNYGKGPGEYIYLADIDIDKAGNLYLCDATKRNILVYNIDNNELVKVMSYENAISHFVTTNEGFVFYRGNREDEKSNDYNILVLDSAMHVKSKEFPYRKGLDDNIGVAYHNLLLQSDDLLYSPLWDNNIYSYNKSGFYLKYKFDFGKHQPDDYQNYIQDLKKTPSVDFVLQSTDKAYELNHYHVNSNYFLASFMIGKKRYQFIYSLKSDTFLLKRMLPYEASPGGCLILGHYGPFGTYNNQFIGIIDTHHKDYIEREYLSQLNHPKNMEILESLKKINNPVLVLYTLKDF